MGKKTRPRLGRGLSSLIGDHPAVAVEDAPPGAGSAPGGTGPAPAGEGSEGPDVRRLAIDSIVPSPHQPRREIDEASLAELGASIKAQGVIQPIVVRPITIRARTGAGDDGGGAAWELVAGERRWRAATGAGLERIPAIVVTLDDREAAQWAIIENVQREDLNPIERAWALRRLCEQFSLSHGQAGERVGLARASVTNLVRLTELEEPIQSLLAQGELGMGHARALLATAPGDERVALARRCAAKRWSVREMERRATRASKGAAEHPGGHGAGAGDAPARLANRERLERELGEHLGTRVSIRTDRSGTKGRLIVEFFDLDHFDGLTRAMGFRLRS